MTYVLIFWGNGCTIQKVLILQKKVLRIIVGVEFRTHCRPIFISKNVLRSLLQLTYMFLFEVHTKSNCHDLILNSQVHGHETRNKNQINAPFLRLHKTRSSYESIDIKLFNKLPPSAHLVAMDVLKHVLYNWLVLRPFYNINGFVLSDIETLHFS